MKSTRSSRRSFETFTSVWSSPTRRGKPRLFGSTSSMASMSLLRNECTRSFEGLLPRGFCASVLRKSEQVCNFVIYILVAVPFSHHNLRWRHRALQNIRLNYIIDLVSVFLENPAYCLATSCGHNHIEISRCEPNYSAWAPSLAAQQNDTRDHQPFVLSSTSLGKFLPIGYESTRLISVT